MKAGIVVFPGSNCDRDLFHVLNRFMPGKVEMLWHKDHDLKGCDAVFLPGGFSFGDYLRSGAIARFSPIMQEVSAHAARGGFVMGICNGFQVLCEAGLLPGALIQNTSHRFMCMNVFIKAENAETRITNKLIPGKALKIPIAHGEGRYYHHADELKRIEDQQQVVFRYCNVQGNSEDASNPNGSLNNIAGVRNKAGNVFGMMPHPERASDSVLGNTDGLGLFESIFAMQTA